MFWTKGRPTMTQLRPSSVAFMAHRVQARRASEQLAMSRFWWLRSARNSIIFFSDVLTGHWCMIMAGELGRRAVAIAVDVVAVLI
jgi:hypothetical protein